MGCGYAEFYALDLASVEALATQHPDQVRIVELAALKSPRTVPFVTIAAVKSKVEVDEGRGRHEGRMLRRASGFALLALLSGLTACGSEVGRVPFRGEGSADATMTLRAGGVGFWADLDVEYEGSAALAYHVDLVQQGSTVARATCNPLGRMSVKVSWLERNWGGFHSRRGTGKMDCAAQLPQAGATTVKARLAFSNRPAKFALRRADLVLKQ